MPRKPKKEASSKFFLFKNKPLIRKGETLYYGNMFDPYVAKIHIKSTKEFKDLNLANKVSVQLISTDESINLKDRIVKIAEKGSLYAAIDIADAWMQNYAN